jgi:hypothetical protein
MFLLLLIEAEYSKMEMTVSRGCLQYLPKIRLNQTAILCVLTLHAQILTFDQQNSMPDSFRLGHIWCILVC